MNITMWIIMLLLSGYLIGSFHGSFIAQWLSGVKVKEQGLKNSGASNATIVLGWKYGSLVALIDIGKGLIAVLLLQYILHSTSLTFESKFSLLFLLGAAVIIGHNYPLWMKFDGGKGTASLIGIMFAIDWRMGMVGFALLIFVTLITDYLLVGVLFLYLTLCGYTFWFTEGYWSSLIAIILFLLAIWKHTENVLRIKNGTEPLVSSVLKKKKMTSS
ncbi:glycerol-3-phosphate acyltransferase [Paenisporosarcina sp. TG20]|uniref:glycerol-3-phosphate acyltransferase n=1 Tax=Paenisporosarcina sp. TG20 TaxID=1211706 RepID=UPI0002DE48F8|nr:glycerol-3-phosphate acyltransferase [Paenisporosarcina sp. TG20]